MSQIPVSKTTFSKLNVLKTKSIVNNEGSSITWDIIIDSLIENASINEKQFLDIAKKNGKRK